MYCRKQTNLWERIVVLFIILVSGCSANGDIKIKSPHSEAQESTKEESLNVEKPAEGSSGRQITEVSLEDIEGPGRLTSFKPEQDPLFDFYNVSLDWPRVVPLMSAFKVSIFSWIDQEMYAVVFKNMSISRANNFYTNAQKKHFSSNIWGQDPATPSITEGPRQVFHYIGERHKLSVFLMESSDNILYFELYFSPSP